MSLLTGLFRKARKRLMTADADMNSFKDKLNELVAQKDTLADEDIVARVDELVGICNDIPDGDDKAKLLRYLEDFKSVKEQDPETAQEAANMVVAEYEKLDKDAMNDAPDVETPAAEEEPLVEGDAPDAEEPAEDAAPDAEENAEVDATTEEVVEETEAPATKDEEPSYTLEDIYQYCKKRDAEEAGSGAEDAACGDKEEQEVVQDHALRIPVTTKCETTGSLAAMFENVKRGRN